MSEQAALRRVATLVAKAASAEEIFSGVAKELALLSGADTAQVLRYDPDGTATVAGGWSEPGVGEPAAARRVGLGGRNVTTLVFETGQPARVESYAAASGPAAADARAWGLRSAVGVPIMVEGRPWGVMFVGSAGEQPFPPGTEDRIADFTALVGAVIAHTEAREQLRQVADEQATLRRVATLVARATPPDELFSTVTEEVGRLLSVDLAVLARLGADVETLVAAWSRHGEFGQLGKSFRLGGKNVASMILETGRPARIENYAEATGEPGAAARDWGLRACVGVPIHIHGRLWGVMYAASTTERTLPPDTEQRLTHFTELVATAIANAQAHAEATASRARIVATADATRRKIERDLHDGAQQRLVSIALQLRALQASVPPGLEELAAELDAVVGNLTQASDELREYARGIHPALLTEGGLTSALRALARRSPVPVHLDVKLDARLPEPIEVTTYYVVSEALTNAVKHANASGVTIAVEMVDGVVRLEIKDDGVGGADPDRGSGLLGLRDRVEATGGVFTMQSAPGDGTRLVLWLPITADKAPGDR